MSVTLRPFRNGDPPGLVRLWNAAGLGRGAVRGLTVDVFDHLVIAQQHFRPACVTIAEEEAPDGRRRAAGFALSGFAPARPETGVVEAVVVHPDLRGRGIGRRLMGAAVDSLRDRGATRTLAGPGPAEAPFLVGLYGGSEPAGFLDSDPAARPFAEACGFRERTRYAVLQRPTETPERTGFQALAARRHSALRTAAANPGDRWWATRFGRLDTLRFELAPREDARKGAATAGITLIGLDLYGPGWSRRAVGLRDLSVGPGGSAAHLQALVSEVTRKLREEAVDLLEIHADAADGPALARLARMGFEPVDHGTTFERGEA